MTTTRILKQFDVKVTTREATWTQIYVSALESGFTPSRATLETDKAVNFIFDKIGPEREAELRTFYCQNTPEITVFHQNSRESQPN